MVDKKKTDEPKKKFGLLKPNCNINTVIDGRGGIFTWTPETDIKEFNMLYFTPGASRGNHMHPEFTEYFLVVEGSGIMVLKESPDAKEQVIHMGKGECTFASPGVAHAFHAITPVTAIAMLSKPWDTCNPPIIHENVTKQRLKKTVALFGANGFVGSQILKALNKLGHNVTPVTLENYDSVLGKSFDYVINCAMPSSRFKAEQNPEWDYKETVEKTKNIFEGVKFQKFIQISTLSARTQLDTVYGRNKLEAEMIVAMNGESLIVRLSAMYGEGLNKGVLIGMLNDSKVYIDGRSKYAFAPVEWVGEWIAKNLDRKGIIEVGAKNSIVLKDLVKELDLDISFDGFVDIQEPMNNSPDYPDARGVIDFMKQKLKEPKKQITECRFCGNKNIIPCIDLGEQYLSSIFPDNLDYRDKLKKSSLKIMQCVKSSDKECGTLQLAYNYSLLNMYKQYPYTSTSNSSMKKILEDVANSGKILKNLNSNDTILDIGCNDGALLDFFSASDYNLIGIDPAQNVESVVHSSKFKRVKDFFSAENFKSVSDHKAKLVFCVATFYHQHDPIKFCKDISEILDEDGAVIIQMAYLPAMIKTNMYDNIVHEHVGYYGTQNMKWILEKAGLELFDVQLNDVYGGSFRIFAKKKGNLKYPRTMRLQQNLNEELDWGIFNTSTYTEFMARITRTKQELIALLERIKREGKKTWIYGASTKGNTIMQFCGIGPNLVQAAADSNPFKFGKYMIGSEIPIFDETKLRHERPDYLLALPYSFVKGFRERERELVEKGTNFIVPLPDVKVI